MPNDDDPINRRKAALERKTKLCHVIAWPSLVLGVALLISEKQYSMPLAIVFLFVGMAARIYSYILRAEKRSLRKIEEIGKRTGAIAMVGAALFLIGARASAAGLEVGAKAAKLDGLEYLVGGPAAIFSPDGTKTDEKIFLILFWGTWDKNNPLIFSRLADIRSNYPKNKLELVAITTDRKPAAEHFVGSAQKKSLVFHVAVDPERKTAKAYMGEGVGVPLVFIVGKKGNVIWKGPPPFMREILRKIFSGRFDPKTQAEVSELHDKLAEFLQLEDIPQIVRYAEKTLALDPSDEMATRVRIYVFERAGKLKDALKFMDGIVEKRPGTPGPYLVRLDLMDRLNEPVEKRHAAAKEILERFDDDPKALSQLAAMALGRMRFASAPLDTALKAAERAVAILETRENPPPAEFAAALSAKARVNHAIGRLDDAIKDQKRAVELLDGRPERKTAETILDYYISAARLHGEK